ncbi:MAG: IPExxxVDY family protein [Bacteroidetes bacterium]|nr:IPExxxVDY family protein [Bacteroidota bacterium]
MAKKIRLEVASGEANAIVGIATQLRDYRLVHFINKSLNTDLANVENLPVYNVKTDSFSYFTLFHYHHPDLRTDICLVSNTNGIGPMVASLKQINFFLILQGAAYRHHIDEMISLIRKIQGVQAAISINQSTTKDFGPILEDLELHILELKQKEDGRKG